MRKLKAALALVVAAGLVSACAGGGNTQIGQAQTAFPGVAQAAAPGTLATTPAGLAPQAQISARIALLVPLSATGQTAQIATGLKQAAELALFEFNNPGLQLIVKDTAGTPEGAASAATAAIAAGAEIIIGPLFANSVRAVAPIARQAQVPVVAFSSDATVAGNNVYLLSFQPRQEIQRAVRFAAQQGRTRFAALIPDTAYGKILSAEFQAAVRDAGGFVVATQTYPPGASGMLQQAEALFERVAGTDGDAPGEAGNGSRDGAPVAPIADALFLPGDETTLPSLAPIMSNAGLSAQSVKVFGNGGWDFSNVGRTRALVGGLFAAPDPRGFDGFSLKYAQAFGSAPPRIASFAFDGVSLAAAIAGRAPRGERYTASRLTQASGFTGIDGPVRFLSSGLAERALAILEVTENGPVVIESAPQRFATPAQTAATSAPSSFFRQR